MVIYPLSAYQTQGNVDSGFAKSVLTQDLTPPINPMVYPVRKSFVVLPSAPGDLGPRVDAEGLNGCSLEDEGIAEVLFAVIRWGRAGLWGLLVGQNPRSSFPSS